MITFPPRSRSQEIGVEIKTLDGAGPYSPDLARSREIVSPSNNRGTQFFGSLLRRLRQQRTRSTIGDIEASDDMSGEVIVDLPGPLPVSLSLLSM